jgi:hypothetical protein
VTAAAKAAKRCYISRPRKEPSKALEHRAVPQSIVNPEPAEGRGFGLAPSYFSAGEVATPLASPNLFSSGPLFQAGSEYVRAWAET